MKKLILSLLFLCGSAIAQPPWFPYGVPIGGGGGAAIHDSLANHGLGADSSAWFKSVNRVISVGPEWGDSTPGAQVGFQRAVDSACATTPTAEVYGPSGKYLFSDGVFIPQLCHNLKIKLSVGAEITMQDGAWTQFSRTKSRNPLLPTWKSLFIIDSSNNVSIVGGKMDMAGLVHDSGSAGSLVLAFASKRPTVTGVRGGNVNPTVEGRDQFGGWTQSDGVSIRYDGITSMFSEGANFSFNNLANIKYAAISGRCQTFGNRFTFNEVEDTFEGIQSAGYGLTNCGRGFDQLFAFNTVKRYRAQAMVSHDSAVKILFNTGDSGLTDGTYELQQNCILASDGNNFLIEGNICFDPYPDASTTNKRGAIGFSGVRDVLANENIIQWRVNPGATTNTVGYGFEERTRNITISGGNIDNVGVCVYQTQGNHVDTNVTIDGLQCNRIRHSAALLNGVNGLFVNGGIFRAPTGTLENGIRLNWGVPTGDVTATVQNSVLDFANPPTNGAVIGNGGQARITNVTGYNPLKVGRYYILSGNAYPPVAGASAIVAKDSVLFFGVDTAVSTGIYITKMGTRKIGSPNDTATYPAFKGTHKPTVQVMGDASITVSPLAEVVVTTVSLTGQRDITLDDPAVYGPNRCITIRDAGFINGGNTIGVDPGAFPIDGTPSVMGMSSSYDVLKLCTTNAADGWILEYAK